MRAHSRRILAALLLLECCGIAWLVLSPSAATPTASVYRVSDALTRLGLPVTVSDPDVVEFALNVVLFVPLTALAALLWTRVRVWQWVLAGFITSSSLEWLQLTFLAGRSSTSRDIIANTLGAWLGAGAVAASVWLREIWAEREVGSEARRSSTR